ncbi:hypothetical protein B0H14DRAFT_2596749 [Mycena olivaceomarginata]|nr:hypothetical protein B0H14DRAFT_2596749 [Mycena olivaceomarginata]
MHVQLHMSVLTFSTKGIPIKQYEKLESKVQQPGVKSSANIYKKNTYIASNNSLNWNNHVHVYNGHFTGFDAAVNIHYLDNILLVYKGDIPANCCTAVRYTISHCIKYNTKAHAREDHISFNLQWAVVLEEPESAEAGSKQVCQLKKVAVPIKCQCNCQSITFTLPNGT